MDHKTGERVMVIVWAGKPIRAIGTIMNHSYLRGPLIMLGSTPLYYVHLDKNCGAVQPPLNCWCLLDELATGMLQALEEGKCTNQASG